ncbi:tape measure domain-containing protein [Caloranaerobacter azorensis DSM 13643]|uniref:Tape measure domain-containing protein n=1 Tax=Caloranaerobacter azorensis DSM 13643 TaxID=1121264 RepID=A0A1M5VLY6_9FIRM|nr:tape measure protein [Caloranaerobacter azorensis]SHH76276.1 tape measure domain-containing protein [Caloranaerobacter azorensis DSM 13643]
MATLKAMFKLFDGYSRTIGKIEKRTQTATDQILKASGATDKFNKKLKDTGASANIASSGLGKLIGTFLSFAVAKKGIDIADEYTNTAARLSLINDGLQTQAELQEKILAAANRSRGSYLDMANAISKMGLLAGDAFKSNDELIAFTELVQKSFKVGRASSSEQASALLQLSQAMAAGRLQGDEFRAITENASIIADAIAKYMGKSKGELKELSAEGVITADIIKNAVFMAADDINNKFETMPMTFGDVWNRIKNDGLKAFDPVIQETNELINSEGFNKFIDRLIKGFYIMSTVASGLINIISKIGFFFANNWSIIEPLIWGIIGALIVYNATMGIAWLTTLKTIADKAKKIALDWAEYAAIFALIWAQDGLNAALAACPITWIITGVIALIAVFYAAIAVINKLTGTSISATGIIIGAVIVAAAFIGNVVIGLMNSLIQVIWTIFVEPFIGIIEWVLNAANGGFNSFGGAVANLIGQIISWFLSLGKVVTKIIDAIFGTDWTSGLSALQEKVLKWGKNEDAITINREAPIIKHRFEYGKVWDTGYKFGEKVEDKISSLTDLMTDKEDKEFDLSNIGTEGNPLTIEGIGSNGKVEVDMSDEDLKYLQDIAQREYINKFSTATLAPNIQVSFGDVHKEADVDKVARRIRKILQEQIATAAEGSYA